MKSLNDINISGKSVFVRVDFNVPLDAQQRITDDIRIREALPTLKHIIEQGAKLIIASHLGRPKGEVVEKFSMKPAAERLKKLLGKPVLMATDCIGEEVKNIIGKMKQGDVVLLENLRFHKEETENSDNFAKQLAQLCDVYVNDAFAVCHRKNASVAAVTKFAPVCAAGFLLKKELDYFEKAVANPARPFAAVIGGAKVSSKLKVLENLISKVDKILIGGAMANTFLKAQGFDMGKSLIENDLIESALTILQKAKQAGVAVYLPVDAAAADSLESSQEVCNVLIREFAKNKAAFDIGKETSKLYSQALQGAKTIIWNGPMGVFEQDRFKNGTMSMSQAIASNNRAVKIAGGGDTDAALHQSGLADKMTYISTGGGAFLKLLEGGLLPAVEALN